MIRNRLKRMAKRLLGDKNKAQAPPKPTPARPPVAPAAPRNFDLELDADDDGHEDVAIDVEVDSALVADWISEDRPLLFVDIREVPELMSGHVEGALLIPMSDVPDRKNELPKDRDLVLYCAAGNRTYQVAHYLREQGYDKAWSMLGGIGSWLAQGGQQVIPPSGVPHKLVDTVKVGDETGTIQEIRQTDDGVHYTVGVVGDDNTIERREGLTQDDIAPA